MATVARTQETPVLAPDTESQERRSETGVEEFQSSSPGCCAVFLEPFGSTATLAMLGNGPSRSDG